MENDKNITSEKALADKTTNYVCSKKGKGVGKKSKGKENQVDKKNENKVDKKNENKGMSYFATGEEDINEQIAEYSKENPICKLQLPGMENKKITCEIPEKCPVVKKSYDLNDTVLVRYFIRNKWKYYVGFIEKITKHEEHLYCINFLKTTRRQQHLTFVEPKKKDTDKIPESLLVKKIELKKKRDQDKVYYLAHDEDAICFE